MRKLITILLVFLFMIALSLPAMAVEGGQDDEGFYVEELPAFGEDDELIFPTEETPMPEPVEEATTVQESDGEDSSADEQSLQNDPVKETTEEEENRNAESLSPLETELTPSENHILPVIIVAVLLAVGVTVVLIKKRKPKEHRHLDR